MSSYRDRIYARYASAMQDARPVFDAKAAQAWGGPYATYLRGWLPADKGSPLLEVACGGGRLLHTLARWGYRDLQGVDLSPEQCALSRQVLPEAQVHQGDATAFLRAHPGSFEAILGLDVIEHLAKDEVLDFLDAALLALRPGGRLILQTPNAAGPWGAEYRYGDFTHEVAFTPEALGRLMKLAGFAGFEAREMGPVPHGLKSALRTLLWRLLRLGLLAWNYVEMGHPGSRIFTRIMLVSGRAPGVASR